MVRTALAIAALLLLILLSPLQALAPGRPGSDVAPPTNGGSAAPVGQETSREVLSLLAASPLIVPTPGSCAPTIGIGGPLGAIGKFIDKVTDGIPIITS